MASVQFAPLAIWITDELLKKRMYDHLHALQILANRSDGYGLSRCRPRYIGEMIGVGRDKADDLLEDFVSWGWLKIHEQLDPFTRRKTVWNQLSPDVLSIRDDNVPYALELWGHESSLSFEWIESPSLDPQPYGFQNSDPDFDPESESRLKPPPPPESVIEDDTAIEQKSEPPKSKKQGQTQPPARSAQPPAPNGAINPLPRSAAPPPQSRQERARKYAQQLASGEKLAQQIVASAPTRIWQAREMVDIYGAPIVEIALTHLKAAKETETILNPFGLLNYWLKHGMITPQDKADRRADNPFIRSRPEDGSPYEAMEGGD